MLLDLLIRDLSLHRRVLWAATVLPLVLAVTLGITPSANGEGVAILMVAFGLALIALLPLSLQAREGMLGTLGDLLALPIARRDLVRLRYLEGLLFSLAYAVVHLVSWTAFHRATPTAVWAVFRSPAPTWILLIFLAWPLPFYLRWRGKGVGLAFGLLVGGTYAWAWGALRTQGWTTDARWVGRFEAGWQLLAVHTHGFGGPLLLAALCYAAALRAADGMEA